MSGSTAGYVDAGPVIAGALSRLAALRRAVPVLSHDLAARESDAAVAPRRRASATRRRLTRLIGLERAAFSHR